MDSNVSVTKEAYIDVYQYSVKKSNQFTCVGWVNSPAIPDGDPLIFLAVSNLSGSVLNTDSAVRFEVVKDGTDYRLQFSGSLSKKIAQTIKISLNDTHWHFLGYVCTGEGAMHYYVDGIEVPSEDGVGDDGVLYSKAWSRSVRQGGGDVWSPYLYKAGQAVSVYRWRFGSNFQIHQGWLQQIMAAELPILEATQ